ncbi:MAG TPA: hypothetical protein VND95_03305 [Stellaceae bacterium]|nr:hypothetical protein [Stellaceae bacterium]
MAWAFVVSFDSDKPNVGSLTGTFTDTDSTVFTFSERLQATTAALNSYVTAAIAARNVWQTRKAREATALTSVKAAFVAAGEQAP